MKHDRLFLFVKIHGSHKTFLALVYSYFGKLVHFVNVNNIFL
jgi:hypothetical protein